MSTPSTYPFARFISLLSVHTILLVFTAGWLPRSTLLLTTLPSQASSKDKPQHPFLHPLTADPLLTVAWLCAGFAVTQVVWAAMMKREIEASRRELYGEDEEEKIKRRNDSRQGAFWVSSEISNFC